MFLSARLSNEHSETSLTSKKSDEILRRAQHGWGVLREPVIRRALSVVSMTNTVLFMRRDVLTKHASKHAALHSPDELPQSQYFSNVSLRSNQ